MLEANVLAWLERQFVFIHPHFRLSALETRGKKKKEKKESGIWTLLVPLPVEKSLTQGLRVQTGCEGMTTNLRNARATHTPSHSQGFLHAPFSQALGH